MIAAVAIRDIDDHLRRCSSLGLVPHLEQRIGLLEELSTGHNLRTAGLGKKNKPMEPHIPFQRTAGKRKNMDPRVLSLVQQKQAQPGILNGSWHTMLGS